MVDSLRSSSSLKMIAHLIRFPLLPSDVKGYPAEAQGLKVGDKVIAIDGKAVKYWEEMTEIIHKHTDSPLRLSIERDGKVFEKEGKLSFIFIRDLPSRDGIYCAGQVVSSYRDFYVCHRSIPGRARI